MSEKPTDVQKKDVDTWRGMWDGGGAMRKRLIFTPPSEAYPVPGFFFIATGAGFSFVGRRAA